MSCYAANETMLTRRNEHACKFAPRLAFFFWKPTNRFTEKTRCPVCFQKTGVHFLVKWLVCFEKKSGKLGACMLPIAHCLFSMGSSIFISGTTCTAVKDYPAEGTDKTATGDAGAKVEEELQDNNDLCKTKSAEMKFNMGSDDEDDDDGAAKPVFASLGGNQSGAESRVRAVYVRMPYPWVCRWFCNLSFWAAGLIAVVYFCVLRYHQCSTSAPPVENPNRF